MPRHVIAAFVCIWLATASAAHAHRNSVAYSTIEIAEDRREAVYRLVIEPPDLAEVLGLDADVHPSDEVIAQRQGELLDHALEHIRVLSGSQTCPVERIGVRLIETGDRFVELAWRIRCDAPIRTIAVEYKLFFEIDPGHQGFLRAIHGDRTAQAILSADQSLFVWQLAGRVPDGLFGFLEKGVEHILHGFDHIAFLLGLLLVAVIARRDRRWHVRGLGDGLRRIAGIVTCFTAAHSITLIAASLGWISLPGQLVESVIAASIVYVAVENAIVPNPRNRTLITFAFGLVHGLGFASQLDAYLPPADVVWPLLLFNLGVELGQLAIVICVLPLIHAAARISGGERYRNRLVPVSSAVLIALGLLWLVERLFEVTVLGF
ncbi:MAG: HupE/UreJ family protein [Proteobacteria bacterium]|nr:HupE/UreJ family protein [Pseudomonadota bacterium]